MINIDGNPLCNGNPAPPKLSSTIKVIQLTGDIDRETGKETLNQTGKRFGIYGTDLGVSFILMDNFIFCLVILIDEILIQDFQHQPFLVKILMKNLLI